MRHASRKAATATLAALMTIASLAFVATPAFASIFYAFHSK